tara:strand:+ start:1782 stop:2195 length:414 start_codon:yes stop_codon:yes gene_type:complete
LNTLEKTFWALLKSHLPTDCHHQRIETGSTGRGIPDVNLCWQEREVWVELKVVQGRRVAVSPEQCAWHYRRHRAGGVTFIMARDKADGVRKGKYDRIYLWHGRSATDLLDRGLDVEPLYVWEASFDWDGIIEAVFSR